MTTIIDCLKQYKNEIIDLSENHKQKKFMRDSFSRWYINTEKSETYDSEHLFPKNNLIVTEAMDDLKYANSNLKLHFNIHKIIKKSNVLFNKYNSTCKKFNSDNYQFIPNKINNSQEDHLRELYRANNSDTDDYELFRNKLIALYDFIGMNNMHLSIPPIFKGVELFGSPLNTHNLTYCSPFTLEERFGSLGSFFKYNFHKNGTYLCNPPFDETLINNMADKLIQNLGNTPYQIVIIITIPIWDSSTQKKLNLKNYGLRFEGYDKLINSMYLMERGTLDKFKYPYYNYYTKKKSPASHTHLIFLSNLEMDHYKKITSVSAVKEEWANFSLNI